MRSLKQVNDRLNEMARLGRILDSSQTQKERDMYTNRTKSKRFALCATVAALLLMLTMPVPAQAESHEKSLYDRLGGYDAVSAVVDDFAAKLFVDEQVGKFFVGMGTDTREQFRQKNKNLVCNLNYAQIRRSHRRWSCGDSGTRVNSVISQVVFSAVSLPV